MIFTPQWESPVRLPKSVEPMCAEPEFAIVGSTGSWILPFRLARDIQSGEPLIVQFSAHRNNKPCFVARQSDDPRREGYVTARTEDGKPLKVSPCDMSRRDALVDGSDALAVADGVRFATHFSIEVPSTGLREGSTIFVTAGDRSGGGPGVQVQNLFMRGKFFILYVIDPEAPPVNYWTEKNNHQIVGLCRMNIIGGGLDKLYVYAPSQVRPDEPFPVVVRPQDCHDNLSPEMLEEPVVYSGDKKLECVVENLPDTTCLRLTVKVGAEGVHRLRIVDVASGTEAVSNPIRCSADAPELNVYWGMIHGHTEMSDGYGSLNNYFRQLRDECALDFAAPGDHDHLCETSDAFWQMTCDKVKQFHEPGRFIAFLGYEFAKWRGKGEGDRNVYYFEDDRPIYRSDEGCCPWPNDLFEAAKNENYILIPHHTALAPSYLDWEDHDPVHERLVEIYQVRGSYECSAGDGNPLNSAAGPKPVGFVRNGLAMGWRVGFTAGGDDHSGTAGTDCTRDGIYKAGNMSVLAAERTREAIWDALWNRRVVATSGPRVLLDFTLNGFPIGAELDADALPSLREKRVVAIEFHGMANVKSIDIIRSGKVAHSFKGTGMDMCVTWEDSSPLADALLPPAKYCEYPFAYYYVRVVQEDNETAWASPIWIQAQTHGV